MEMILHEIAQMHSKGHYVTWAFRRNDTYY